MNVRKTKIMPNWIKHNIIFIRGLGIGNCKMFEMGKEYELQEGEDLILGVILCQ